MRTLPSLFIARGTAVLCALAFASGLLWAQPSGAPPAKNNNSNSGNQQQQPPQHRGPPQEALDACKALKSGQDCNFTSPHGAVKGSCFAPEGRPLACRPKDAPRDGGPNGGQSGPPPAQKK